MLNGATRSEMTLTQRHDVPTYHIGKCPGGHVEKREGSGCFIEIKSLPLMQGHPVDFRCLLPVNPRLIPKGCKLRCFATPEFVRRYADFAMEDSAEIATV